MGDGLADHAVVEDGAHLDHFEMAFRRAGDARRAAVGEVVVHAVDYAVVAVGDIEERLHAHAVTGLSRYLHAQREIAQPIRVRKALPILPAIYEQYLCYRKKYRHASDHLANHIRRVLYAFDGYCQRNDIRLRSLKIDHVDAFRNECFDGFAGATRRVYRIYLRGFLSYLYHERQVLTVDLAPLVTGRREYGKA